ncbi:hypothetical protein BABINDRAFT_40630 [Babjeviella inositovora NRRL Y-12698]|uniref:SPS-sensor component PTR3 n=1 Tax=Babjeviella inositovora NRRL Y-12698 TaxID=984486 RepID=A0A1E3QLF1_9ASCO|nr:uncharacterized protein BABINDRAFT_40630 [Babjeviella inositovora NRRL Y-12698]ODQ77912.1 hypothetical protein BABINDRAFT_40630 [Babjeviella inositovora NRRL Y-12698]
MSLAQLKELLHLPARPALQTTSVERSLVGDCSMLTCGCLISESYANILVNGGFLTCPVCSQSKTKVLAPVEPLRALYRLVRERDTPKIARGKSGSRRSAQPFSPNATNFMNLFYDIAKSESEKTEIKPLSAQSTENIDVTSTETPIFDSSFTKLTGDSISKLDSRPANKPSDFPISPSNLTKQLAGISSRDEGKEYNFAKCFPMYRKQYQHATHQKFFKPRSQLFIATAISPDMRKFVLLGEKRWEVYEIPEDPARAPTLVCCGKSTGEYGTHLESLQMPSTQNTILIGTDTREKLKSWEHLYCALSDRHLVIAGTRGVVRVIDLELRGTPVYTYCSSFPIRCVDISPDETYVACGITGKERLSGTEQTLIVLHQLKYGNIGGETLLMKVEPITITLPYRDPINSLSFSLDLKYLACSTVLELRFMVISVENSQSPRLILKSLRSLDTSLESEGITDIRFFPDNKLMAVSSVAFNAPPIIIRTKIDSIRGVHEIAQPVMVMRVDEVGSTIHRIAVSPRGDALAFLDRNGMVYVMLAPDMHHETRRVVIAAEVTNAYRMRESASIRFSKNGHRLYIVDRRGVLYIQDFAAGLPLDSGVAKCKILN